MPSRVISLIILVVLLAVCVSAQTKGTVNGFTKDPTGAFVPGANVTVTDQRTGATRTTTTDQTGFYQVLGLVPSVYTIQAEATGFERYRNTGVILQVDQNVRADILLKLGELQQTVEVTGASTLVDTRSSQSSALIDDRRIVDLPLGNRNVYALAKTLPGVVNITALDNTRIDSASNGPRMSVNAGRPNTNYIQFNGIYFMMGRKNYGLNAPPPDAIQEFKIQTSNFTADTGFSPNSSITVVSKQGTNDFQGTAWEFLRNDNLNARSFFQATKPTMIRNQYGASAGGPIRKNKLFIFGTVEMENDRSAATVVDARPPSTAELAGDFSYLNGQKQLYNPFDGTPFSGNHIPVSLFDSAALQIQKEFIPTVQNTGQTLQGIGTSPRDSKLFLVRSDLILTHKQTLFGSYYLNQNRILIDGVGAFGSYFAGFTGQKTDVRVQTASLSHTYTISPTTLNQLTLGYTRSFSVNGPTVQRTPESLGIKGMPMYQPGSPRFRVSGRWNLESNSPNTNVSNNYEIKDDMSLIRGRHTVRFGFMYVDIGWLEDWGGPPAFTFSGVRTGRGNASQGDALADFLLGGYDNVTVVSGLYGTDQGRTYMTPYVSDDIRVSRRLTLNLGLRWELGLPWVEKYDRIQSVIPDPKIQSRVYPQAPPGMLFPGDTLPNGEKMPRGLRKVDKNNISPRVGLAYDVFGDGRTVIRAGYGLFYETEEGFAISPGNAPFVIGNRTYRDGLLSNPFGSIGAVPLPVAPDPTQVSFTLPVNGQWGPQRTDLAMPEVHNWSFFIERELLRNWALSLGYIGKHGQYLPAQRPFNAAKFIPGTDANGNPLSTRANIEQRVPFLPGIYGTTGLQLDNYGRSNYHSLQIQLRKRFSSGFQFDTSYVLSKALQNDTTGTALGSNLADPYNPEHNYGRSPWDSRHVFVFSGIWSPPVYQSQSGVLGRILGGWSLSGITTAYSGKPLTFDSGQDTQLNGMSGRPSRADIVGDPHRSHSSRADMVAQFFNIKAFQTPATGSVGTSGVGILSGPANVATDLAILKDIRVREAPRFQFRAELLNAFNQVNFSNPVTSLASATFGKITTAGDGRIIQLGLKFLW